jgi:hypothetical protein
MKNLGEESRLVKFSELRSEELLPERERLIPYLLEHDVPVYFRVDPAHYLVYRYYRFAFPTVGEVGCMEVEGVAGADRRGAPALPSATPLPVEGFLDCDLAFLRLDRSSLEQIHISGSCPTPHFTRGGLVIKPIYRVIGHGVGGRPIREVEEPQGVRELIGVEFDEAVVVDKNLWNQACRSDQRPARIDALEYAAGGEIRMQGLFLDETDAARLRQWKLSTIKRREYPFLHEERMPGLYWMYQAAYVLNELAELKGGKGGVGQWLMDNAPEKTFRYRSMRTAKKFVWLELDRNQGGKGRGEFDLERINELRGDGARLKYEFSFTSDGLTMILAIADFWHELTSTEAGAGAADLAKKLMMNGFAGLEVGDLVYLISGKPVDLKTESVLRKWVEDGKLRKAGGEMGWRDVIDREERKKLLQKLNRDETERDMMARKRKGSG